MIDYPNSGANRAASVPDAFTHTDEARLFLASIVDSSQDSIITINFNRVITTWNKAAERLYGYTAAEAVGRPLTMLTLPEDVQRVYSNSEKIRSGEEVEIFDTVRLNKDGTRLNLEIALSPIKDPEGNIVGVSTLARDVTARRQAERALADSNERLGFLIESVTDYAILSLTLDSRIDIWNTGAERLFGWTESEAVGQPIDIIFTPEDREKGAHQEEINVALECGRCPDERYHMRKDGSRFYATGVMTLLKDEEGNVRGFAKIARDLTSQVEAQRAARDKEMLQKLVSAQEVERGRIARDLHDEIGQQITVLQLKLISVKERCDVPELCAEIDIIHNIAHEIDNGVDFLAWQLRPAVLDDLGIHAALERFVDQWSHHSEIPVEFNAADIDGARFTPEIETNLYRIVQEALNNCHKHASAENVSVVLKERNGEVVLLIEDDGIGFDLKDEKRLKRGMGLSGMRERAELVGGKFEIETVPGRGTSILIIVPIHDPQQDAEARTQ